ncbi:MAG: ribosome rescue protein RqcH [Pyrobaculum sp.]
MKKGVSAFDLLACIVEIQPFIKNRLENIYKTEIGFLFKFPQGFITVNKFRVSPTNVLLEKTHVGAETLRGLFREERLLEVSMPRFDRIIEFKFQSGRLVVELVEPFNVIAVRDEKIVWLLHSYRGKDRQLKAGAPYVYPPQVFIDLLKADVDEIAKAIDPTDVKKSLVKRLGTGHDLADELIARVGIEPEAVAREIKKLVTDILSGHIKPSVCIKNGAPVTVLPIRPAQCDEVKHFDKFWMALDFYFSPLELKTAASQASSNLIQKKKRLEATIAELEKKISEFRQEAARLKAIAHKLLTYKYEIEEAMRGGESSVRIQHVDRVLRVELPEGDVIELKKGLGQQITDLFDKAKEYEEKAAKAVQVLEKLRRDMSRVVEEQRQIEARIVVERSWFEKFRWTITTGLKPIIGGRDASQNEAIVRKYLKDHYLFFHADIPGASAVVMPPAEDPLEVLQAAQFAAAYSKAWKIGIHAVDVYYVRGGQVSKSPPSGQYLAKGSFMIYGKREYVKNVRLELAVGCRKDDNRVVTAPPKSAPLLAERYAVVTPGNMEKSRLAKELANRWGGCTIDEIAAALPGPSRISEHGKGSPLPWGEIERIFSW